MICRTTKNSIDRTDFRSCSNGKQIEMRKIAVLFPYASFLLATLGTSAQTVTDDSTLPPCPKSSKVPWKDCKGQRNVSEDVVYSGEWADDLPDGRGTLLGPNRRSMSVISLRESGLVLDSLYLRMGALIMANGHTTNSMGREH